MNLDARIEGLCALAASGDPVVTLTLDVSESGILPKETAIFLRDRVYRTLERARNGDPRAAGLASAATRIRSYVGSSLRPGSHGLYLAAGNSIFEAIELNVPLRNSLQVGSVPGVAPLVEAAQRWPRTLCVRYDDRAVEIREFDMGSMEVVENRVAGTVESNVEHSGVGARAVRHGLKAGGSGIGGDRRDRYHQRVEGAVEILLRRAARSINERVRGRGARLLLEGSGPRVNLLRRHLSPAARASILDAGRPSREEDSGFGRVTQGLQKAYADDVERWALEFHARRAEGRGVALGPEGVILALAGGSVARLYVTADDPVPGARCGNCGSLFAGVQETCSHCGGEARPVSLAEEALRQAIRHETFGVTFIPPTGGWLADLGGMAALLGKGGGAS